MCAVCVCNLWNLHIIDAKLNSGQEKQHFIYGKITTKDDKSINQYDFFKITMAMACIKWVVKDCVNAWMKSTSFSSSLSYYNQNECSNFIALYFFGLILYWTTDFT